MRIGEACLRGPGAVVVLGVLVHVVVDVVVGVFGLIVLDRLGLLVLPGEMTSMTERRM